MMPGLVLSMYEVLVALPKAYSLQSGTTLSKLEGLGGQEVSFLTGQAIRY